MKQLRLFAFMLCLACSLAAQTAEPPAKVRGGYSGICQFCSRKVLDKAIAAQPSFLMDKHKQMMHSVDCARNIKLAQEAGFDTLFLSIYPLYGMDWWKIPEARNLVKDALIQSHGKFRVHLGISFYNARTTQNWTCYPGALKAVAWDGKHPEVLCFLDDSLWHFYTQSAMELAKIGNEVPGSLSGIYLDPEAYGPEGFLCFCDNCIRKFNRFASQKAPLGLEKPLDWIVSHGQMNRYLLDWHDQEVRRHAADLRKAVHRINPRLQLSSFLWDFPNVSWDTRPHETFYRNLAFGLGTREKPAWGMPEHTYYLDTAELDEQIRKVNADIKEAGFEGQVRVLPGLIPVGRPASSLIERGKVIGSSDVVGYWLFQLSTLEDGTTTTPDGALQEPAAKYREALREMNKALGTGK